MNKKEAGTRISDCYPPDLDATRTPIAYGDRALPRMNRELKAAELITRQRSLMSLCDYLKDPEHVADAIRQGTIELLTGLLFDNDPTVRRKSAECLFVLAGHAIGREAFVERKVIAPLSCLFQDPVDIVRLNTHAAFARAAQSPMAGEEIVEQDLMPVLVNKLNTEMDDIIEVILDTLHFCFKVDVQAALNCGAMRSLRHLLIHSRDSIRAKAAKAIMGLTVTLHGKEQAIEEKCVSELVELFQDDNTDIKINAVGALMRIVVTTKGKYTALECEAIRPLIELIKHENSELRLYALKAIACLGEAPEGRRILLTHEDEIRVAWSDPIPAVSAAAETALKVITWKP